MLSFLLIKSLNMVLNGARGLVLASLLGPHGYGVFGTLIVLQQYSSYLALGMREGVAIKLARSGDSPQERRVIYSSALAWGVCSGLFSLAAVALAQLQFSAFADQLWWVWLISLFGIVNEILININRHEQKLRKVAVVEFVYTAITLLLIGALWSRMTVSLALQSMLTGLFIGVAVYLATVRPLAWKAVSLESIRELLKIGILPALFSAVIVVANSVFVPIANTMRLGEQIGLVVLAYNVSMMILFGLNTVAWGLAAKSMQRHYVPSGAVAHNGREDFADILIRLGVVAAVLCALLTELLFSELMTEYAGASIYVLYFVLFQSYALLLFSETNFLNVNARLKPVICGYALMLALIVAASLVLEGFVAVLRTAVFAYFVLGLFITLYCRRLGFRAGSEMQRVLALCFPVACMVVHAVAGMPGLISVCVLLLALLLLLNKRRVTEYFAVLVRSRSA